MKQYIDKYKIYILIVLLLICGVCIFIFLNNNKSMTIEEEIKTEENNSIQEHEENIQTETKNEKIKVDIKGSITNPGVYEMNEGDRVDDVIKKAGGLTKNSDVSLINLSKKVTDEMVIKIYTKEEIKALSKNNTQTIIKYIETECNCPDITNDACISNSTQNNNTEQPENIDKTNSNSTTNSTTKISINTATKEQLTSISGIGDSKAEAIINYRNKNGNFKTIEDIKNVSGIGDSLFEKIKDYIII